MTKKDILQALRENDGFLSGQELSEKLGVSRTAVWKGIRRLEEEGYQIEAFPNRGYRIVGVPDTLSALEIQSRLRTGWIGKNIVDLPSVTSTNRKAGELAEDGAPEGTVVVADEQTEGRGRLGRSWSTPKGEAIAFSLLLRPEISGNRISMLTLVMGLAVTQALKELYPAMASGIKWPNDVVVGGKKVCGILTEMNTDMEHIRYIIIGVGINTGVRSFPPELEKVATSIFLETEEKAGRALLTARVLDYFEQDYAQFLKTQDMSILKTEYERYLLNMGKGVRVLDPKGEYEGTAEGIDDAGRLLVRRPDGTLTPVYAGEVSVRGIYGYV